MAKVTIGGRSYEVEVRGDTVLVDGHEFKVKVREEAGFTAVNAGGVNYRVQLPAADARGTGMKVGVDYRPFTFEYEGQLSSGPAPRAPRPASAGASVGPATAVKGSVAAQIAGRVLKVNVKAGDSVAAGDVLLMLEAMKMENEIKAPRAGVVKEVVVKEGDRVPEGATLVILE
jgi:biotin carboxyl carrier protein